MGWSGGTEIFDCVVDGLDNSLDIVYCPQHTDEEYMKIDSLQRGFDAVEDLGL